MKSNQSEDDKQTASPKRIGFKYRSGPAALRCLSDGSIYFAKPSELNDCLEAKFDLSSASDYIERMDRSIRGVAEQHGCAGGFAVPEGELESFEAKNSRDNVKFLEATQRVGIYSTASRPDNQPMWAYYCDNSKGFCFELEWPDTVLGRYQIAPVGVLYSSETRVHNHADIFDSLIREEAALHPEWSMSRILEETRSDFFRFRLQMLNKCRAVSIKHSDWSHEHEIRFVTPLAGPLPIMNQLLKRVYFVRTDFPQWEPVMMLLHQLHPNVELVKLTFQHVEPYVKVQRMTRKLVPIHE
ncbi:MULTISPECIES: DUF2971 domain-containing protein [Burkholderia]|uniref:DUF2971 domain-containing protein n=3 Tax=Burkholderiaceae TaxID=119060 RepID=UPI00158E281C|nr:DUF2971 domain-containing protein [Burkholderia ambifaria]